MTKVCADCGVAISDRSERCRSCAAKAHWRNPEVRGKRTKGMRAAWADDVVREERGLLLVRVPAELLTEDVARELAEGIVSVHV